MKDSMLVTPHEKKDLSPFAQFSLDTKGKIFHDSKGREIDKWEAFLREKSKRKDYDKI